MLGQYLSQHPLDHRLGTCGTGGTTGATRTNRTTGIAHTAGTANPAPVQRPTERPQFLRQPGGAALPPATPRTRTSPMLLTHAHHPLPELPEPSDLPEPPE